MYNFSKETKENRKALFEFVASKKNCMPASSRKTFGCVYCWTFYSTKANTLNT